MMSNHALQRRLVGVGILAAPERSASFARAHGLDPQHTRRLRLITTSIFGLGYGLACHPDESGKLSSHQ
jgi:hypothetical protein